MRPLRAAGRVPEDGALDAEHSSCSTTPLQTGRIPDRARRTASQLREGSYGRDLGTRPSDDGAGVSSITQNSWKAPMSKPIGGGLYSLEDFDNSPLALSDSFQGVFGMLPNRSANRTAVLEEKQTSDTSASRKGIAPG